MLSPAPWQRRPNSGWDLWSDPRTQWTRTSFDDTKPTKDQKMKGNPSGLTLPILKEDRKNSCRFYFWTSPEYWRFRLCHQVSVLNDSSWQRRWGAPVQVCIPKDVLKKIKQQLKKMVMIRSELYSWWQEYLKWYDLHDFKCHMAGQRFL